LPALARCLKVNLETISLAGAVYLSFEFAIVCSLPLMAEVLPAQRATTMATYLAATSIGIGLGAWLAPLFYSWVCGPTAWPAWCSTWERCWC
jgi:predicted MFS family arabinose efflux permease